jgi:hypothetical protein
VLGILSAACVVDVAAAVLPSMFGLSPPPTPTRRAVPLTLLHLLGPYILVALLAPVVVSSVRGPTDPDPAPGVSLSLLGFQWAVAGVTCAFVVTHRRHLMVWSIFAPKLAFEVVISGAVTAATLPSVLCT